MASMRYFEIWYDDALSIITTMQSNLHADLEAGYDPQGHCVRKQIVDIEERQRAFERQMDAFKYMEDAKVNRWCYYDLKKRGAIS